jgi:hypothetical protein
MKILGLLLLGMALPACESGPPPKLVWRRWVADRQQKSGPAPNFRITIVDEPKKGNPRITIKVEQQKYWVEIAKGIRQQYKRYKDKKRKPEPLPHTRSVKTLRRITGKSEWFALKGSQVTFRLPDGGGETQVQTDEKGLAQFDVTPFTELWVEGKSLTVDVTMRRKALTDPDPWSKVKGKDPVEVQKKLKLIEKDFVESVRVRSQILKDIFDGP